MAAIATRADIFSKLASGKGAVISVIGKWPAAGTTAAAGPSGWLSGQLGFEAIGTTLPGTLVGGQLPPGLSAELLTVMAQGALTNTGTFWLVNLYKLGTLNLAATGDQFTHDTATYPATRTLMGQASQPLDLVPLLYVTTANTTTAPQFILRSNPASAGYKSQNGLFVVGTKTFVMPAGTIAVNSMYMLRLEEGDSAIQDITQIDITVAGTAGAATIFGMEFLANMSARRVYDTVVDDQVFGGLSMKNLEPAVAATGTAVSYLALLHFSNSLTSGMCGDCIVTGVLNS